MAGLLDGVVLEELSGGELLDHAADLARMRNQAEVDIVRLAVQHAYLHDSQTLGAAQAGRPGRERVRRIGGRGTPEVTEFAAAELGARLGMSTVSVGLLMADGLDLAHRLPGLWARVRAGEARVYLARLVARRTRDLTAEQAAYVDARVAPYADGRLTYSRFQALVEGTVAAADAEATAQREREAAERQVALPTGPVEDGMQGFYIRGPVHVIKALDATLDRLARLLAEQGDTDTLERRRVTAILLLCRPDLAEQALDPAAPPDIDWAALVPAVTVHVHLYGVRTPTASPGWRPAGR